MGLTYHFSFGAPARTTAHDLEAFLRDVEIQAVRLGFQPTVVVNGPFDTAERRDFARRVARGLRFEDERLKGVDLPDTQFWSKDPVTGSCRLAPEHGVVLVVTDERGRESVFGFFRYPRKVRACDGRVVMPVPGDGSWASGNFVVSPDPRYRAVVRMFADAGYLVSELDEYAAACGR